MSQVPAHVIAVKDYFDRHLPDLRGVRNTDAHLEDRSRGLGASGKPLNLKGVDNQYVYAPGALSLQNLYGNRYGSTMADGSHGEVEVSYKTLIFAACVVQTIIDAFQWEGEPRTWP